jgi:hypothetical protein
MNRSFGKNLFRDFDENKCLLSFFVLDPRQEMTVNQVPWLTNLALSQMMASCGMDGSTIDINETESLQTLDKTGGISPKCQQSQNLAS